MISTCPDDASTASWRSTQISTVTNFPKDLAEGKVQLLRPSQAKKDTDDTSDNYTPAKHIYKKFGALYDDDGK